MMKRLLQVFMVLVMLMAFAGVAVAQEDEDDGDGVAYTVQAGDHLMKLAREFFGEASAFERIVEATNRLAATDDNYQAISNPNIILVGQRLWIPGLAELPEGMDMEEADMTTDTETDMDDGATDTTAETVDLAGTRWEMTSLRGQPPLEDTTVSLEFGSDGEASGTSGCNGYGGTYETEGITISFGPLVGTLIACEEPVMEQENSYRDALDEAAFYEVTEDGELRLFDADTTLLVTFAPASTTLEGTSWNVLNYNNGNQAVVSVLAGTELTVVFGEEISGSAGCNNFFGSFTAEDGAIEIGPLAATRKLCPQEDVMDQEAQFLTALESAATYRITGDRLELRTADDAMAANLIAQ
jgi:heat shock protein HslJ